MTEPLTLNQAIHVLKEEGMSREWAEQTVAAALPCGKSHAAGAEPLWTLRRLREAHGALMALKRTGAVLAWQRNYVDGKPTGAPIWLAPKVHHDGRNWRVGQTIVSQNLARTVAAVLRIRTGE